MGHTGSRATTVAEVAKGLVEHGQEVRVQLIKLNPPLDNNTDV
jgi:hypothetical protein